MNSCPLIITIILWGGSQGLIFAGDCLTMQKQIDSQTLELTQKYEGKINKRPLLLTQPLSLLRDYMQSLFQKLNHNLIYPAVFKERGEVAYANFFAHPKGKKAEQVAEATNVITKWIENYKNLPLNRESLYGRASVYAVQRTLLETVMADGKPFPRFIEEFPSIINDQLVVIRFRVRSKNFAQQTLEGVNENLDQVLGTAFKAGDLQKLYFEQAFFEEKLRILKEELLDAQAPQNLAVEQLNILNTVTDLLENHAELTAPQRYKQRVLWTTFKVEIKELPASMKQQLHFEEVKKLYEMMSKEDQSRFGVFNPGKYLLVRGGIIGVLTSLLGGVSWISVSRDFFFSDEDKKYECAFENAKDADFLACVTKYMNAKFQVEFELVDLNLQKNVFDAQIHPENHRLFKKEMDGFIRLRQAYSDRKKRRELEFDKPIADYVLQHLQEK